MLTHDNGRPALAGDLFGGTPIESVERLRAVITGPPANVTVTAPDPATPRSLVVSGALDGPATTDAVLYWNATALEADRVAHTTRVDVAALGPVLAARALAIVHLARHDAHAVVTGGGTYLDAGLPTAPAGASVDAAIAAAARATLASLYPSQIAFFDLRHREQGLSDPGLQDGHQVGLAVARAILADRANDPDNSARGYATSPARAAHREDPSDPGQGVLAPFYGRRSKLFSATDRHGLEDPPQPGTTHYDRALRQVRAKGIAPHLAASVPSSLRRTPDETCLAYFWAYDGATGLGTPPRLYNQIVRVVALDHHTSLADNARLFALVNVAMADAGILAWDQKYLHDLWRPVVGVREHSPSMGPTGVGGRVDDDSDPFWLPVGAPRSNSTGLVRNATPNFPAYPSGHATFGAAAFQAARRFFGQGTHGPDSLFAGLDFVSEELNGTTRDVDGSVRPRHVRSFPDGLWGMIIENGLSRVMLGVHWVFDAYAVDRAGRPQLDRNIGGVPLGLTIADDIATNSTDGINKSVVGPRD